MTDGKGRPMGSDTNVTSIQSNTVGSVGIARIAVGWADAGPPVEAEILVFLDNGEEQEHVVRLGETFPVVDETWRFADVDFETQDWWTVTIRRVDETEPQDPPTGRHAVYERPRSDEPARLRPYGRLNQAQLASLRAVLGQELPPAYERWLSETNGVRFEDDHEIADVYRDMVGVRRHPRPLMIPAGQSLLGVDPAHPDRDLVAAQRTHRDPWMPRECLAIGVMPDGVLFVMTDGPETDSAWYVPRDALPAFAEGGESVGYVVRARLGVDIEDALSTIHPLSSIDVPPDAISYPDRSDPMYWDIRE